MPRSCRAHMVRQSGITAIPWWYGDDTQTDRRGGPGAVRPGFCPTRQQAGSGGPGDSGVLDPAWGRSRGRRLRRPRAPALSRPSRPPRSMTFKYLEIENVLQLAARLGEPLPRDLGLVASAVGRPRTTVFGADAYLDVHSKAAALMHSLARNR